MNKLTSKLTAVLCSLMISISAASISAGAYTTGYKIVGDKIYVGNDITDDTSADYPIVRNGSYVKYRSVEKYMKHMTLPGGGSFDRDPYSYVTIKRDSGIFGTSDLYVWYIYDLGCTVKGGIGIDGTAIDVGGCGEINASILTDNRLKVQLVKHDKDVTLKDIRIDSEYSESPSYKVDIKENDPDSLYAYADLTDNCFCNGVYRITGTFECSKSTCESSVYLFVNCSGNKPQDYEFYVGHGAKMLRSSYDPYEKRIEINELLTSEGVTPEKALNASRHYPEAVSEDEDDRLYWEELAPKIIRGNEKAPDCYKALLLHDWITSHLKYDYYKANVLKLQRYYKKSGYGRILDASQYVSQNYTGVCLDFSSIYAVMCRECGIPCVVLTNDTHAWNAVYLDGRWYEADLTMDVNRGVFGEDTNAVTGTKLYCYDGFCKLKANSSSPDHATDFCW